SDHEVNIKILTGAAEARGKLDRPGRDRLLQSMTGEVAAHVLAHNRDQTLALSLMQRSAVADLDAHAGFMAALEREDRLDRALEGLPDAAAIVALRQAGLGLTRPELSVLLAYGKNDLFDAVIAGSGPDDPFFFATLKAYFPSALEAFSGEMRRHRLRREIIATVVGNDIVNLCGPTFPRRLMAAAGCDTAALLVGFAAAKETLRFDASWAAVAALDGQIPAEAQTALYAELSTILRAQTYWLARRAGQKGLSGPSESRPKADVAGAGVPVDTLIEVYQPAMDALRSAGPAVLSPFEQKIVARRIRAFRRGGAPNDIAANLAVLSLLTTACDLADLAKTADWPIQSAALVYHQASALFGFDRLRAGAGSLKAADAFERLAVRRLIEDLVAEQTALTHAIIAFAGTPQAAETAAGARSVVRGWAALHADTTRACEKTLASVEAPGDGWSFAKLTIAAAALRELGAAAR
ncbi:MAG TPA: NAD-glutamate dehydrogenase domain-containing protein, partial [Caulobacteraceae bacterium]